MHGSGAGVDPGGVCARGAGVYGNPLYFLLNFGEPKAALKNKPYFKKGRREEEEYALFFFYQLVILRDYCLYVYGIDVFPFDLQYI